MIHFKIAKLRQFCSKLKRTISGLMGCLYLLDGWTEGYQMSDSCKVILTNSDDGFINCLEFEFDIFRTFSDDGLNLNLTKLPIHPNLYLAIFIKVLSKFDKDAKSSWQIQTSALSNVPNLHLALNCCKYKCDGMEN